MPGGGAGSTRVWQIFLNSPNRNISCKSDKYLKPTTLVETRKGWAQKRMHKFLPLFQHHLSKEGTGTRMHKSLLHFRFCVLKSIKRRKGWAKCLRRIIPSSFWVLRAPKASKQGRDGHRALRRTHNRFLVLAFAYPTRPDAQIPSSFWVLLAPKASKQARWAEANPTTPDAQIPSSFWVLRAPKALKQGRDGHRALRRMHKSLSGFGLPLLQTHHECLV